MSRELRRTVNLLPCYSQDERRVDLLAVVDARRHQAARVGHFHNAAQVETLKGWQDKRLLRLYNYSAGKRFSDGSTITVLAKQ